MGLALIIIIVLLVIGVQWLRRHPEIVARWVGNRIRKRYERMMRQEQEQAARRQRDRDTRTQQRQRSRRQPASGPVIPKEYAQDVEFSESRIYASDQSLKEESDADGLHVKVESQVSDVEWEEIKTDK